VDDGDRWRQPVSLVRPAAAPRQQTMEPRGPARPWSCLAVLACYLLGALAVTARLWRHPAGLAQDGDIRDVDQFTWFVRHAATAVSHGRLPALATTALNPPHGVNLMWNTSFQLPSVLLTPVTVLSGPQVSLNVALAAGFFLSATSLFLVLRWWRVSVTAAALGGALYGFSPAMIASGIGHYHLVLAPLPPLIIDALLRILTGRGRPVWLGLWLAVLTAAQLFTGEEMLVETAATAAVVAVVLAVSRPGSVRARLPRAALGLGTAAVAALLLCARGLWVQFHGVKLGGGGATTVISYHGHLTHIHALPQAFVTPSSALLFHTSASAAAAARYPQPTAEYLAYLGVPLIVVLVAASLWFWRQLPVRIMAVTLAVLELCSLGAQPLVIGGWRYPGAGLPWYWLQKLPVLGSALPDRLAILAAGSAAVVLAFAVDQARARLASPGVTGDGAATGTDPARLRRAAALSDDLTMPIPRVSEPALTEPAPRGPAPAAGRPRRLLAWLPAVIAAAALLPLVPRPYPVTPVTPLPPGYEAAFARLHLPAGARVLVVPVPTGVLSAPMRWQGDTGEPASMIGGAFIAPGEKGRRSRAGRAGQTVTTRYLDELYTHPAAVTAPTAAQLHADLASWRPAAVVAVTRPATRLARYLIKVFGPPSVRAGHVLAWRLPGSGG
jgi:hypothetical protein